MFDESGVFEDILLGRMENYHSLDEIEAIMDWLLDSYEDTLLFDLQLGKSFNGEPIMAYVLMETGPTVARSSRYELEQELSRRQSLLINAVHHARELTTITMTLYTLLHALHSYEHGDMAY